MTDPLVWVPAVDRLELLAGPVRAAVESDPALAGAEVAEIDPAFADTDALHAQYGVDLGDCANCVVVAGRRGDQVSFAACLVLAAARADVNGVVRRHLGARKASFAPLAEVVTQTGMEFGGITPVGLPAPWALLIAEAVASHPRVVIGSGLRNSKLRLSGSVLTALPAAKVLPGLAVSG
jgi:prolyl-tRNA editing enzyme YbaK/EbsC (Cys-tRNA(Pro) deacylase)